MYTLIKKAIPVMLFALLLSLKLMAQTGVAIINVSDGKVLSGEGVPFELSFVVKDVELETEAITQLRNALNEHPEKYTVTLIKDDVKPDLLLICEFKTETFELLNTSFHEILSLLNPRVVLFNEQEFTDFNAIVLE